MNGSRSSFSIEQCLARIRRRGSKGLSIHKLLVELMPDTSQRATESGRFMVRHEDDDLSSLERFLEPLVSRGLIRFEGDGITRRYFFIHSRGPRRSSGIGRDTKNSSAAE